VGDSSGTSAVHRIGAVAWDEALVAYGTTRARVDEALRGALRDSSSDPWAEVEQEVDVSRAALAALPDAVVSRLSFVGLDGSPPTRVEELAARLLVCQARPGTTSLLEIFLATRAAQRDGAESALSLVYDGLASLLLHGDAAAQAFVRESLVQWHFDARAVRAMEPLSALLSRLPREAWGPVLTAAAARPWPLVRPWLREAIATPSLHDAIARALLGIMSGGEDVEPVEVRAVAAALTIERAALRDALASALGTGQRFWVEAVGEVELEPRRAIAVLRRELRGTRWLAGTELWLEGRALATLLHWDPPLGHAARVWLARAPDEAIEARASRDERAIVFFVGGDVDALARAVGREVEAWPRGLHPLASGPLASGPERPEEP
jgi:hypothetical protein